MTHFMNSILMYISILNSCLCDVIQRVAINSSTGILHKGDGTNIYLKERPRKVVTVLGNGKQRRLDCKGCDGTSRDSRLMSPVALASGRDGSLYVGDFNHIRKLSANREDVTSILKLRYHCGVLMLN